VRDVVERWFSLTRPVDRGFYAASGFGLALVKYAIDAGIIRYWSGAVWTPIGYLNPSLGARESAGAPPPWLFWALVVWSLPFYWIGISMTVRRTMDAGLAPGWALLFFLPIVNYLYMLLLCALPRVPAKPAPPSPGSAQRSSM